MYAKRNNIIIALTALVMVSCYNMYLIPESLGIEHDVKFPYYNHSEPICWYLKDLGMRIAIFMLSACFLLLYRTQEHLTQTLLLLLTGFLLKDVFDYALFYDHAYGFLDIGLFMGFLIYYIIKL